MLNTLAQSRFSGLARIVMAGLIWGSIPLVLRAADGASAVKVFFRVMFAALVIGGYMLATGGWREFSGLSRSKWRQVIFQGALLTVNWLLFLTALDMTDVATAELLGYTGPVFVAVLAPFVTGEAFDRRIIAPLALSMGGIVVIVAQHGVSLGSERQMIGAGLAFASAITYAALLLRSKRILRGISSGALMLVEYMVASVLLAPLVIAAYARGAVPSSPGAYGALVTLGVVHTAISGFIFLGGLRQVRTDHAAVLMYIEPVSAVLFAALFLAEPLTPYTIAGGVLVVAGGLAVARLERRTGRMEAEPLEVAGLGYEDDGAPRELTDADEA
ncbi:MAG: DMT family transporter [Coriobacteriia bacterium]